jgi:hypothetical protein
VVKAVANAANAVAKAAASGVANAETQRTTLAMRMPLKQLPSTPKLKRSTQHKKTVRHLKIQVNAVSAARETVMAETVVNVLAKHVKTPKGKRSQAT